MSIEPAKIVLWLVAGGMILWMTVPFLWGAFEHVRGEIREAREHGEPVSSAFAHMGNGCVALVIKGVLILTLLVVVVMAISFLSGILFEPAGPEHESWRY
jgi:hypothetical protein